MRNDSSGRDRNTSSRILYLLRGLYFLALAAIVYVSLLPGTSLIETGLWDKLEHFCAYALIAVIGSAAFPRSSAAGLLGFGLTGLGIALELAQTQVSGRFGDPMDALANGLGVLIGLALARIVRGPR